MAEIPRPTEHTARPVGPPILGATPCCNIYQRFCATRTERGHVAHRLGSTHSTAMRTGRNRHSVRRPRDVGPAARPPAGKGGLARPRGRNVKPARTDAGQRPAPMVLGPPAARGPSIHFTAPHRIAGSGISCCSRSFRRRVEHDPGQRLRASSRLRAPEPVALVITSDGSRGVRVGGGARGTAPANTAPTRRPQKARPRPTSADRSKRCSAGHGLVPRKMC